MNDEENVTDLLISWGYAEKVEIFQGRFKIEDIPIFNDSD